MMKHVTLTLALIAVFITGTFAQIIPNANMEDWIHTSSDNPVGWATSNVVSNTVFKDSIDVNSGNYAARLVAGSSIFGTIPGAIGTGVLDILNQTFTGGFPVSDPYIAAFTGYYKYAPVGSDVCLFYSILTAWDAGNSKRDTVAVAIYSSGAVSNYTFFAAPFTILDSSKTADSALVIISTTADIAYTQAGSTLWVDDIDFTNNTGISPVKTVDLQLFPNPADQRIEIRLPASLNTEHVQVYAINGQLIKTISGITSDNVTVNTSQLAEGTYLVTSTNKQGFTTASGKFVVKH